MPGYLTPDNVPDELTCRVIQIPNDERWIAVVTGALNSLAEARNWQADGELTPEECASAWMPRFDDFCFKQPPGGCRVIGEIVVTAGNSSPSTNWLACDGSSLLRADYPELFGEIGTAYGSVDGSHFNLPDLRGRAVVGIGQGTGLTNRSLGDSFGSEQHTLSVAEMPSHAHSYQAAGPVAVTPGVAPIVGAAFPAGTGSAGSGSAHNNMQPSLALSYWIVAQ